MTDTEHATAERLRLPALTAVAVALAIFSINTVWIRKADAPVTAFAAWRMWWSLPMLAPIVVVSRLRGPRAPRSGDRRPLTPRIVLAIGGVGVVFGTAAIVNFAAIEETTLVNVGVINALQPVLVGVVAGRWLGEVVDWRLWLRAGVAVAGAGLVAAASSAGGGSWSLHGDVLAALGTVLNAGWFLAGRWIRSRVHIDAPAYMLGVFTAAAMLITAVDAVATRSLAIGAAAVGFAFLTAVGGTTGHTLIAWSHRYLPASLSSLVLLLQPVMIGIVGWIVFSENLTPLQLLGAAIVIAALTGIVTREPESAPTPAGALPDARDEEQ